ncbi:MAG: ATP-dependent endonuclease [Salinibacterium sp.]|nr:MAG: ATP-dependent endonuclease [Salinibacterium sp.]
MIVKLSSVRIQNFKGLRDVTVPLSQFGCLIGENNSGKSSVLQALLLLLGANNKRPTETDFFDKATSIRIELQIDEIDETDLARIANDAHRASFAADVVDRSIRLIRILEPGPGSKLQLLVSRRGPANDNWTNAIMDPAMKGHSGEELRSIAVALIPELDAKLTSKPTQAAIRVARDELTEALDDDQMIDRDEPLATGLDAGIKNFLPEPIYIEAVKDVADEVKTTDTATFGKLLGLLLEEVQDQFADVEKQFRVIQRQLSRVLDDDGVLVDDRIGQVQAIESMINRFVRESFPDVDLTISVPVPKMKTILSSAEISANDGHDGPIVSKGDGLKRAVAFAILRAYTSLRSTGITDANTNPAKNHYWLLFEEPELYLYPRAQKQLFSALEVFAKDHPVMVTTHSPLFFDADATQSFIKFRKVRPTPGETPFTEVHPIVIDDVSTKAAFQIICHENNSIGFFAKEVVLVEGDSDVLLFQHIAKLLNPAWDAVERNIAIARTNGKGNIANYRTFFEKFDIPVHVICDLDALVSGFDKLHPTDELKSKRSELLQFVDTTIASDSSEGITQGEAATLAASADARALWNEVEKARAGMDDTEAARAALALAVESFFDVRKKPDRVLALREATGEIDTKKREIIEMLRSTRTYVLALGAVENYYASSSESRDKVKQAIDYCAACSTLDVYRNDLGERASSVEVELRTIMTAIFEGHRAAEEVHALAGI